MTTENATPSSVPVSNAVSCTLLRCAALARAVCSLLDEDTHDSRQYAQVLALELANESHELYVRCTPT